MNRRQLLGTAFVAPFIPMEQEGEVVEPVLPWWKGGDEDPISNTPVSSQVLSEQAIEAVLKQMKRAHVIFPVNSYGVK